MDSHLIYSASSQMKNLVTWNDWVYCGLDDDIRYDVIEAAIHEHFHCAFLYFITNRSESEQIPENLIIESIKRNLGKIQILVWDTEFRKVIEFDRIGVMRSGAVLTKV